MMPVSKNARVAGLLYILTFATGGLRDLYIPRLIVPGNAAATASNIAAHESLFHLSIVGALIASPLWILVSLALYRLLKDVDRALAVVMVVLSGLIQTPLFIVNSVSDAAALLFIRGPDFLSVFDKPQRDAFAMVFLNLHDDLDLANSIVWGLWLLPFGLLVYKSRFVPRFLGVWLILACFTWLVYTFTSLLLSKYQAYGLHHRSADLAGRGSDHALAPNHGRQGPTLGYDTSVILESRHDRQGDEPGLVTPAILFMLERLNDPH